MEKIIKSLLTEDVLNSVALCYSINRKDLYFVGGFENFIYGFDKGSKSYIVRITHSSHRSKDDIQAEMDFIFYLASHGASVSTPIRTKNDELIALILLEDSSYFIVSAFTKARGESPTKENVTDKVIFNYGKTIGEFHALTKKYHISPNAPKRMNWDEDSLIVNAHKYLKEEDIIILERLHELMGEIKKIPTNHDNYGLIHTDIHMGNFFIKGEEISVFDFDDASYQYFVSDIAIALFYLVFFMEEKRKVEVSQHFMKYFMNGYISKHLLSKEDFLTIELFLKLRELILYIVIYRTLDIEESAFAKQYIALYRQRIIDKTPFISLDWNQYI